MIEMVGGIYAIINKQTGKHYIGSSDSIGFRWGIHIAQLEMDQHCNKELQDDYNRLGNTEFSFEIKEVLKHASASDLKAREQEWIEKYRLCNIYNQKNADKQIAMKYAYPQQFINYMNDKWLVPKGVSENDVLPYRIWRQEDKQEIINLAVDCKLFDLVKSKITFLKVVSLLQNSLGYEVEKGRTMIDGAQHTYRLVISFDENSKSYVPVFQAVSK